MSKTFSQDNAWRMLAKPMARKSDHKRKKSPSVSVEDAMKQMGVTEAVFLSIMKTVVKGQHGALSIDKTVNLGDLQTYTQRSLEGIKKKEETGKMRLLAQIKVNYGLKVQDDQMTATRPLPNDMFQWERGRDVYFVKWSIWKKFWCNQTVEASADIFSEPMEVSFEEALEELSEQGRKQKAKTMLDEVKSSRELQELLLKVLITVGNDPRQYDKQEKETFKWFFTTASKGEIYNVRQYIFRVDAARKLIAGAALEMHDKICLGFIFLCPISTEEHKLTKFSKRYPASVKEYIGFANGTATSKKKRAKAEKKSANITLKAQLAAKRKTRKVKKDKRVPEDYHDNSGSQESTDDGSDGNEGNSDDTSEDEGYQRRRENREGPRPPSSGMEGPGPQIPPDEDDGGAIQCSICCKSVPGIDSGICPPCYKQYNIGDE